VDSCQYLDADSQINFPNPRLNKCTHMVFEPSCLLLPKMLGINLYYGYVAGIARWRSLYYTLSRFMEEYVEASVTKVPNRGGRAWSKVLSIILVIAILGALGVLGYVIAAPKKGEVFTEFYLLGLDGKAMDYPEEIEMGQEAKVVVGIVNHEQEVTSYRVEVRVDGVKYNETELIVLDNDEQWEGIVSFIADSPGENKKVEFLLYQNGDTTPHLKPLFLYVNVME